MNLTVTVDEAVLRRAGTFRRSRATIGGIGQNAAAAIRAFDPRMIVAVDVALVVRATSISADHRLSCWDALIVAAAASAGCERVWSEHLTAGQTIAGVRVQNPFT